MVKYFISFDDNNNKNYENLMSELNKFNAIEVMDSLYCIRFQDEKTDELRNHFQKFIEKEDGLLLIKSAYWAGFNLMSNPNEL